MNWAEFFDMGGYAFYVWTSWGLTFLVMAYLVVQAKWSRMKTIAQIKRQIARRKINQNDNQNNTQR